MQIYKTKLDGRWAERTEGPSALVVFAEQVEVQLDRLDHSFDECDLAGRLNQRDDRAFASVFARDGGSDPLFTIDVQRAGAAGEAA